MSGHRTEYDYIGNFTSLLLVLLLSVASHVQSALLWMDPCDGILDTHVVHPYRQRNCKGVWHRSGGCVGCISTVLIVSSFTSVTGSTAKGLDFSVADIMCLVGAPSQFTGWYFRQYDV